MKDQNSFQIPDHIRKLKGYVAGKTIAEVKEQYKPERISKLASNENRLGFSPNIKTAVLDNLNTIQDYPDPVSRKLRSKLSELNGVGTDEILVTAGSESAISILCRAFLEKGDQTVTADATFVGFFVQAGVMGAEVKKVPVTNDFKYDAEAILDQIDQNTKMFYLANPNNPTGTYLNVREYEKLLNGIPEHVLFIADEAYYEFSEKVEDYPHAIDYRKKNVIILRTFSKAYGLAGFRIGYAIADPGLISQMQKVKLTFEPTTLAQAAALTAIEDEKFLRKSVELVDKGRRELYEFLEDQEVEYVPSVSNSVMAVFDTDSDAINFTQAMLEQGVILRRVNAFGLPNCVRITIGTDDDMKHFRSAFENIYSKI